jgi:GTPase
MYEKMEPESDDGPVEYKLKLLDTSTDRIERLASQMRYRCYEGNGECIYNVGVEDDGTKSGVTEEEFNVTLQCLRNAANLNNFRITQLNKNQTKDDKFIYEFLIREHNENKYIDLKVAVAGSVDCGKSTLLSVLTTGNSDNGRGLGRVSVFNFPHEIETGRTSSIGHQIVGYDYDGNVTNYVNGRTQSWPDIVNRSSKIISFLDLAGHEKYLKTTIFGLASSRPNLCLIMVAANRGVLKMTIEHIFLCKTLTIPFCVVVTKMDIVKDKKNVLESTIESITTLLKKPGIRRLPIKIKTTEDCILSSMNILSNAVVPIFSVSNVTMEGINHIHTFLNLVPQKNMCDGKLTEIHLDTAWTVNGVGTVVGGYIISGEVKVGDKLWLGPNNNKYVSVIVKSIHCKKVLVQKVDMQTYVCLALRGITKNDFKKGNVLIASVEQQILCHKLLVSVEILKTHSTTIKVGYQPMMHAENVRTAVQINSITNKKSARSQESDGVLRTGDSANILLSICFDKKFIKEGTSILLCEGRTKVIGTVLQVNP